jgi:DNA-binding MarR family transcriptional regulator
MDSQKIFELLQESMGAFAPFYQQEMRQAIEDQGLPNQWFALNLAHGAEPEPFTVERLHGMTPYTKYSQFADNLAELKRQKWLLPTGDGAYRISAKGRRAIEIVFETAQKAIGAVDVLSASELETLCGLLQSLVEASLSAEEPTDKWALKYSRWTDPGQKTAPAVKIDQYLTDLIRFRDDAHIAAWKPLNVSPQAWEALTYLWRNEAHTAEELAEKLVFRGFSAKEYQKALCELAERGWAEQTLDGFRITEGGERLRQKTEEETDRIYFCPWESLRESEIEQLLDLISRLRDRLKIMAAVPEG